MDFIPFGIFVDRIGKEEKVPLIAFPPHLRAIFSLYIGTEADSLFFKLDV